MERRTWSLIGASLVLLGLGVLALGLVDQEHAVRQVGDVVADPAAHARGTYTVVGVPQPATLPAVDGADPRPNPGYANATEHVSVWRLDGRDVQSRVTLAVDGPDPAGATHWSLRNETRRPGDAVPLSVQEEGFTLRGPHAVFLIEGFAGGPAKTLLWGVYEGVFKEPLQPKPSQFEGHIATALPDGTPLPDGALVFWVTEYTAQCSSKFIPPEYEEEPVADTAEA